MVRFTLLALLAFVVPAAADELLDVLAVGLFNVPAIVVRATGVGADHLRLDEARRIAQAVARIALAGPGRFA